MDLQKPLAGVVVVEFEAYPPLSLCGLMLADHGATVIKVGSNRRMPVKDTLSKGKQTLLVNLKRTGGHRVPELNSGVEYDLTELLSIFPNVDVVIESYRPGTMEKMNLGPAEVHQVNKNIIYARLSGFGQTGKDSHLAGHDMTYLAKSGLFDLFRRYEQGDDPNGYQRDKPVIPWNIVADFMAGSYYLFTRIIQKLTEKKLGIFTKNVIDASMTNDSAYLFKEILMKKNQQSLDSHDL